MIGINTLRIYYFLGIVGIIQCMPVEEVVNEGNWRKLSNEERHSLESTLYPFVGTSIGPIFINFPKMISSLKLSQDDSYLFDVYRLNVPGSALPYVLLSAATSSNPDHPPPPFQYPPLGRKWFKYKPSERTENGDAPGSLPNGLEYYKGVPVVVPSAIRKIPLDSALIKKIICAQTDVP